MSLRRLLRSHLIEPYAGLLRIAVVLSAIQTFATLALPMLNARIIDRGVLVGNHGYIYRTGAVMLAFTLVQVVFAVGGVWYGARAAMGFGRDVRRDLFHQVTAFSTREVGRFGAPSLITRVTNDVQQVQQLVVMLTTMVIAAPLTMAIGIVMAIRQDVGVSVVLTVTIPLSALVLGSIVRQMVPSFQRMQTQIDRVNGVLREQITGIRVVRAFVREPEESARFEVANAELTDTSLRAGRLMAAMFPSVMLIINVSSIAVLWVGANRIGSQQMQVGSLVAYLTYLIQILFAVVMLTFTASMVPRAAVAAERIGEVLGTDSSVRAPERPVTVLHERATLELRDVSFHYPGADQPVLSHISLRIGPGETAAIIGATGSGKSTLVNLVPRLADVTAGAVFLDGVDVRQLDLDLLWSKVGFVPQRPFLFSGTVASNLRYGRPDATDEELWAALEIAQATDFVRAMAGELEAPISQGGINVSGGQRQRLCIARALVVKPEIYIFDDSFSALDLATDARLRAALAPHTQDAAVLIVGQRVATIAEADQILVLEDGVEVGLGSHEELLRTCPTYAEIVESQLGEGAAA